MTEQGQSDCTRRKQDNLRYILRPWLKIVRGVYERDRTAIRHFHYIDTNAGSGYNEEAEVDGSPIIFLQEAINAGVPFQAWFVESNGDRAAELSQRIASLGIGGCARVIHGDNAVILPKIADYLAKSDAHRYGLIYCDPNSSVALPTSGINAVVNAQSCRTLDVLFNLNATSVKRCIGAGQATRRVMEQLSDIDKRMTFLQVPQDRWQWAFAFCTNWASAPNFSKIGFHPMDSAQGQEIVARLNWSANERAEKEQTRFFRLGWHTGRTLNICATPGSEQFGQSSSSAQEVSASGATNGPQLNLTI